MLRRVWSYDAEHGQKEPGAYIEACDGQPSVHRKRIGQHDEDRDRELDHHAVECVDVTEVAIAKHQGHELYPTRTLTRSISPPP